MLIHPIHSANEIGRTQPMSSTVSGRQGDMAPVRYGRKINIRKLRPSMIQLSRSNSVRPPIRIEPVST